MEPFVPFDPALLKLVQEQLKFIQDNKDFLKSIQDYSKKLDFLKSVDFATIYKFYNQEKDFFRSFVTKENIELFSDEYDSITSNPSEEGRENFIIYKSLCVFICFFLTLLEFSPVPFLKNLTDAIIVKYGDDENMRSYLDKSAECLIDFIDNNIKQFRK